MLKFINSFKIGSISKNQPIKSSIAFLEIYFFAVKMTESKINIISIIIHS